MYAPKHFTGTDRGEIIRFMHEHPFATLMIAVDGQCHATQIPVMIKEEHDEILVTGHIAKHNDHAQAISEAKEVLLLFTGAHAYVSASLYSKPGQASTWNYMSVQARGSVQLTDEEGTLSIIKELTDKYEHDRPNAQLLENMDDQYVNANLKAIQGFKISVNDLQATFKLNQNKDDESYINVVYHLLAVENCHANDLAQEMMKRRSHLF